ncbi:MAG: hypothetical protein UR42_C0015G0013 [Candidatus Roizmanbacteria bacterium GW2011_GWA2_33_33]|uniref:Uncharacterized protein n=1 Tax=Candidatus Roizmanbacteria bacterium GW2011_GWA2_33_33 TaxID=1618476 RepID=A0A0G0A3V7_9BACT|nr:MAG: hypothetical protein UR42_C0015G0013 [Candidatus Roizmanbacteria bacterium GW2011_GWA2_33_33]
MKKIEDLNKGDLIRADICSRPNAINGKYKTCGLGLELEDTRSKDMFFLETLRMRADLADKMIAEAESQGKDTTDSNIMKELGEKIHATGKPLHRSESIMTAVFVSLQLMAYYGIAIGIWGLVFKKSFLVFGLYGVIVGLLISLLSAAPVVAFQRTKERIRNIVDGVGLMWGNLGIIIGVVGLVVWVMRSIFFN